MRTRAVMLVLLVIGGSMLSLPGTAQNGQGDGVDMVSITFDFTDANTLLSVDSTTVTVIEGWTGTTLEQVTLADDDSLSVMANHSIRLRVEADGYEDWANIAAVYDDDATLTVELTNSSEDHAGIDSNQTNYTAGLVTLGFPSQMSPSSEIELDWTAEYSFSMQYGTELMPASSKGLASQIDLWLGDADGALSGSEQAAFIAWMGEQAWSDAFYGGCCKMDSGFPLPLAPVSPTSVWISDDASTWGWNESATLGASTGFTSSRLLQVPLQNDIRQQVPLRVRLSDPWEYRYSPDYDLISGTPTDFEILRNSSGVGGLLPVTLAQNTAPQANGEVKDHHGQALPFSQNFTLDGSGSRDTPYNVDFGITMICGWTLSTNSTILEIEGQIAIVNLSESGFGSGEQLETLLECSDVQGLNDTWSRSWYIDGEAPLSTGLSGTLECLDDPGQTNLLLCEELAAISSTVMSLNLSVSDDGPAETLVFWNSNHIEGWATEGSEIDVVFWQGQNTNINFLTVNGQHEQREPAVWVFQLRASDEAGNDWIKAWNVTVFDGTAPRINIDLLNASGVLLENMQPLRSGMQLTLDLNSSFDDLHAIEDVRFIVTFDDEVLADSDLSGWAGVRMVDLPALSVGLHDLVINATDAAGNTAEEKIRMVIEPALGIDITSIDVNPVTKTEPGPVTLNFTIVNSGATAYNATICIAEQCYIQAGQGATFEGEGLMHAEFGFDLPAGRGLEIGYSFAGEGEQVSFNRTHDVDITEEGDSSRTFAGAAATIVVLGLAAWIISRGKNS